MTLHSCRDCLIPCSVSTSRASLLSGIYIGTTSLIYSDARPCLLKSEAPLMSSLRKIHASLGTAHHPAISRQYVSKHASNSAFCILQDKQEAKRYDEEWLGNFTARVSAFDRTMNQAAERSSILASATAADLSAAGLFTSALP